VVTPFVTGVGGRMGQTEPRSADQPAQTLTAKADSVLVAPFVAPRYQEKDGQEPRTRSVEKPAATVTSHGNAPGMLVTPYLARTAHGESDRKGKKRGQGVHSLQDPHGTVLASPDHALITPFISAAQQGGSVRGAIDPLHTVTASSKDQNQIVAPFVTKFNRGATGHAADDPLHTVTACHSDTHPGGSSTFGVVAASLVKNNFGDKPHYAADEPVKTTVAGGNHHALLAAHLMTMRNAAKPFNEADKPAHTITSGGAHMHLVAAFMAQHNYLEPGHDAREPVSTIVGKGSTQGLAAVNMVRQFGTSVGAPVDAPVATVMAQGGGKIHLSAAFLSKYYGKGDGQVADDPLHTVTTKDREALVTVEIEGETYVITDIGMRMLTPRELFRAQGFPDSYVIDRKPDGSPISKTEQVSKCGNSICPPMAAALVKANYAPRDVEPAPQFMEAAE
jgi:DNA (cytosine-5)-methyltransferase 1